VKAVAFPFQNGEFRDVGVSAPQPAVVANDLPVFDRVPVNAHARRMLFRYFSVMAHKGNVKMVPVESMDGSPDVHGIVGVHFQGEAA